MDSHNSGTDAQNDMDVLKKMEDEHLRLQRQVRQIQADRSQATGGVHPQFRRQDHLLKTLKKEYIDLKKDLKIARSGAHKKKDKKMKTDLKKALLVMKESEFTCEDGLILMDQLDGLLHRDTKTMLQLKKLVNANMGQLTQRQMQSENRLVSTENRLETAMLRFNIVQCENKRIREEIEHMLKDRTLFNQAWIKMLNALNKGKKFLTDLFESSTLAYDQRDEWCTKLRSMQEKGRIDQMLQLQEMRDLQKAFDHEMKLFHFLAKKGVIRVNKKVEQREERLKKKEEENSKRECMAHTKIVEEITDYSEQNVEKTIDSFELREQQMFGIYKLLTDTCAENEVLSRDVRRLFQEIEDRKDWNEMKELKREATLQRLREELEQKQAANEELKAKVEEKVQLLKRTMEKIDDIFKMLQCSSEPYMNLLGDKGPSLWQMNLTLRLIADQIQELLQIVYYYERHIQRKGDKSMSRLKKYTVHAEVPRFWNALPIGLIVPADPCPSCVETRWLSRVSDTPEVPFTKQMAVEAINELTTDPSYVRSDRIHALTECRVPRSRVILATRYMQ